MVGFLQGWGSGVDDVEVRQAQTEAPPAARQPAASTSGAGPRTSGWVMGGFVQGWGAVVAGVEAVQTQTEAPPAAVQPAFSTSCASARISGWFMVGFLQGWGSGVDDVEVRQAQTEAPPAVADPPGVLRGDEAGRRAGVAEDRAVGAEPCGDRRLHRRLVSSGDDTSECGVGETEAFPGPQRHGGVLAVRGPGVAGVAGPVA